MRIDLTALGAFANNSYVLVVQQELGETGGDALERLLGAIRAVHKALSTERLGAGLAVAVPLEAGRQLLSSPSTAVTSVQHLASLHDGTSKVAVQLRPDGSLDTWFNVEEAFAREGLLVYEYRGPGAEVFLTPGAISPAPVYPGFDSAFSVPYFRDLQEALEQYGAQCIKHAQCPIYRTSWREPLRLVHVAGPEHIMRDSLLYYLRLTLRNVGPVEAMPEQNVDASKPVDIRVTWGETNRVALIEVKWLGKSVKADGKSISGDHGPSRAQRGAEQLADYLDRFHRELPAVDARGYLVIFDGRRRNVDLNTTSITAEDAAHYRYNDISYDAAILARYDFAPPTRLFCEVAS